MFTFDEDTVSDLHKDAYGFRPSQYWWAEWAACDNHGKQQLWDHLIADMRASIQAEAARQEACIVQFEAWIQGLIDAGAANRDMAIRWVAEAHDVNGDMEYLCYLLGIPYGYFNRATI